MDKKIKLLFIFSIVLQVSCFNFNSDCEGCRNEYTRIKRAKFYQNSPLKFYNRPPFSPPIRGPFSYTPPPGYTANDIGLPPNLRPYKVSKRPTNEGLGDDDINNLIKYLSKKDLDKIVEFANEKVKHERQREPAVNNYELIPDDINDNYFRNQNFDSTQIVNIQSARQYENKYSPEDNPTRHPISQYEYVESPARIPLIDMPEQIEQLSFLDSHIQKEIKDMTINKSDIYTDSSTMQEELLPKPVNLRNADYDISFTNNVPSVAKPETSYKLENFADLPLMDYQNSKLYSVNSYNVPHYTVTSGKNQMQISPLSSLMTSSSHISPAQPAPPASLAKDQSDAHLKATKIWTHKSKGTAYTLHEDGTLTLEIPTPKI